MKNQNKKPALFQKNWDYSAHARYYKFRPNYPDKAINILSDFVDAKKNTPVLDIGAGTGNLTLLLLKKSFQVTALEPNDEMRAIGVRRTKSHRIKWLARNGTDTGLPDKSAYWVTFGSSFNVMDSKLALKETYRLLKPDGFFTCMWNHRDLNDPIQKRTEDIILKFIPDYQRGIRRKDQRPIIESSKLFKNIFYLEMDFEIERKIDQYIFAWMSVKNKYWDLVTPEGQNLFKKIMDKTEQTLPKKFKIKYTTRAWTAQKIS